VVDFTDKNASDEIQLLQKKNNLESFFCMFFFMMIILLNPIPSFNLIIFTVGFGISKYVYRLRSTSQNCGFFSISNRQWHYPNELNYKKICKNEQWGSLFFILVGFLITAIGLQAYGI
jgi:hypothetical protein